MTAHQNNPSITKETKSGRIRGLLIRVLLPVLILVGGVILMNVLIDSGPKAKRQPPARQARLVEVEEVGFSNQPTVIQAMGTVRPAREIALQPRVSGEIIQVGREFVPGGRFHKGDAILKIDPMDYKLLVRQKESGVAQARSDLELELGQQSIAEREFELLGESVAVEDRDLVLRKPQLEMVRAALDTAEAVLEQARLNLERTQVRSPFNAIIQAREVNLGTYATPSTRLATLVGTDEYWIEVLVPVDQLKWIRIPRSSAEKGAIVSFFNESAWGPGRFRTGRVIRLASGLEEQGRMAQLWVSVNDPLSLRRESSGEPVMIIGSYVRVEIQGTTIESVAAVERKHIRDGDQIWIMNADDKLEIRPVEILFRGRDSVLIGRGIQPGDRLITTDLAAPVPGMPLRTQQRQAPRTSPAEGPS